MKQYRYRVTLEPLTDLNDDPMDCQPLQFEVGSHDDIIAVVARICSRGDFNTQAQAAAFGVGLKLFSETILTNRDNPLLSAFLPQLRQFMKTLKARANEHSEKE